MIYEKQVRTLLYGLRQDLLYASILWYINTRGIWYMRNRWGHFYAASVTIYCTLLYYGISIQEEYDIWETGEDTSIGPSWRSTIYASILQYINTRGIWYIRNRWGHFYAASVTIYCTLRYYGISIQEEYDIWETGEDTSMRPPSRSIVRLYTMV